MSLSDLLARPTAPINAVGAEDDAQPALDSPTVAPATGRQVFDAGGGRCAVEVVLAPLGIVAWRVRLQPVSIRFVVHADGHAQLEAHVSARPKYTSVPVTKGLFMPATERSSILAFSTSLPRIEIGAAQPCDAIIRRDEDEWPAEVSVRVLEFGDDKIVAGIRGSVARRDDLPLPGLRLGLDAALELRRCE